MNTNYAFYQAIRNETFTYSLWYRLLLVDAQQEISYMGCYRDDRFERDLDGQSYTDTDMTVESCAVYCAFEGRF